MVPVRIEIDRMRAQTMLDSSNAVTPARSFAASDGAGVRELAIDCGRDKDAHIALLQEALARVLEPFRPSVEIAQVIPRRHRPCNPRARSHSTFQAGLCARSL
jgi:hypothetical protein